MVYGKILFNNIKEYTPSFIKTIPYSQTTKPSFGNFLSDFLNKIIEIFRLVRKAQIISRFGADPKVKRAYKWIQMNVQKNPTLWQCFIFFSESF